jgi:amidase
MTGSAVAALGPMDVAYAGVAGQAALVRDGRISALTLVETVLERIAASDHRFNAFRTVLADSAREQARRVDDALRDRPATALGPLAGVPIAIKDNAAVAGEPALLGTGSPQPAATADDELVARVRAAGAIPVGLTQLPELALWAATESRWQGVSRNPWDLDRAPGGSSGGSAAAVAAGLVAAAHATDGLGSIRIPASSCGLVGLKPTHGLLPLTGPDPDHWYGMSHTGFLTRSVRDTALLLDAVLPGSAYLDGLSRGRSLRVAVSSRPWAPVPVDPDVAAGLDRTAEAVGALGHSLLTRDPPYDVAMHLSGVARYLAGAARERASLVSPDAVEPRTRQLTAIGERLPRPMLDWACRTGRAFHDGMLDWFADVDVLLTPTVPVLPARAGELSRRGLLRTARLMLPYAAFTGPWNVCGFPAISVPAATTPGGLPIGMQLVGVPGSEATLLGLAAGMEAAIGWTARHPADPAVAG